MAYYKGCDLKICIDKSGKDVFIPADNTFLNTLVIGNKGTGKSSVLLKNLAYQTILDKNMGGTFVVSSKDLSYELYTLAKYHKRRVVFINPSIDNNVEQCIENNCFDEILSEFNFEKFIFNNYIVIIDIENIITGTNGIAFVNGLMNNLKQSMLKTDITCFKPHFLYVDDAFNYLDSIEDILYYGYQYNIATILFFQNRKQFNTYKNDFADFIDSNISNIILMNSLNYEDIKHYENSCGISILEQLNVRGDVFCLLKDENLLNRISFGKIELNKNIENILSEKLYSTKKSLKKKKNKPINNKNTNLKDKDSEYIKNTGKVSKKTDLSSLSLQSNRQTEKDSGINDKKKNYNKFNDISSGKIELTLDLDDFDF